MPEAGSRKPENRSMLLWFSGFGLPASGALSPQAQ
jgi:hypothetical protein